MKKCTMIALLLNIYLHYASVSKSKHYFVRLVERSICCNFYSRVICHLKLVLCTKNLFLLVAKKTYLEKRNKKSQSSKFCDMDALRIYIKPTPPL